MLDLQKEEPSIPAGRDVQASNNFEPTQRSHAPSGEQTAELGPLDDDATECDHWFNNGDEAHTD